MEIIIFEPLVHIKCPNQRSNKVIKRTVPKNQQYITFSLEHAKVILHIRILDGLFENEFRMDSMRKVLNGTYISTLILVC